MRGPWDTPIYGSRHGEGGTTLHIVLLVWMSGRSFANRSPCTTFMSPDGSLRWCRSTKQEQPPSPRKNPFKKGAGNTSPTHPRCMSAVMAKCGEILHALPQVDGPISDGARPLKPCIWRTCTYGSRLRAEIIPIFREPKPKFREPNCKPQSAIMTTQRRIAPGNGMASCIRPFLQSNEPTSYRSTVRPMVMVGIASATSHAKSMLRARTCGLICIIRL